MRYFDNTRVTSFMSCPRKYYFRHVRNWTRVAERSPLVFGQGMHDAMDVIWTMIPQGAQPRDVVNAASAAFRTTWDSANLPPLSPDSRDIRSPELAYEIIEAYIVHYYGFLMDIKLIEYELPFVIELGNPSTADPIYYIGRLDKVFERAGEIWIAEHKTSSSYAATSQTGQDGFQYNWIRSFSPNNQISGYLAGGKVMSGAKKFGGLLVDGILVHKKVRGFHRIPFLFDSMAAEAWVRNIGEWVSSIIGAEEYIATNPEFTLEAFPMATEGCFHRFGTCDYADICRYDSHFPEQIIDPPDGFELSEWHPFDEAALEKATTFTIKE